MFIPALLPPDTGLVVTSVTVTPELIGIAVRCARPAAPCPRCDARSERVHSRYVRTVADLPWQGRRVVLRLTARRFRCSTAACTRSIFCERFPAALAPHARTTDRLTAVHRLIGFALGGEPGARLCQPLAVPTSPDTLLRRVKATPLPQRPAPRILGVDDFAFRRRQHYGTILVDLERRCVVDLLPDRTADTLATWLRQHPGIEVVSRDRASAYAQAVTAAAPTAIQVADRFHLMVNAREAAERALARHTTLIRDALRAADAAATPTGAAPPLPTPVPRLSPQRQAVAGRKDQRRQRYEQVRRWHAEGQSIRTIARALRMSPTTVIRYLRAGSAPDWRPGRTAPKQLDPHREFIDRRVGEGCRNARALHRELKGLGYTGGYDQVRRAIRRRTDRDGRSRARGPIPVRVDIPTTRRLSFELLSRPDGRADQVRQRVERLRAAGGAVQAAIELAEGFAALVRGKSAAGLEDWLNRASASGLPEFVGLAQSLRQDERAVRAGLTETWSQGQVEGRVGRLKLIKRAMFGRAGFMLLKARVLNTG